LLWAMTGADSSPAVARASPATTPNLFMRVSFGADVMWRLKRVDTARTEKLRWQEEADASRS